MRILISGAGIAGPTLAWWLARNGHTITILEKMSSMRATGQNIDISGCAITVVKKMGLLDEVRRHNTTETGTQLIDSKGRPFAPFPLREHGLSATNEFEILRGDLAGIFYEATKDHPNVEYVFGTTVKTVLQNDDKAVKVEYSNGEQHSFDFAVAADGQWSPMRKQCFPADSIRVRELGMYVAHWTVPRTSSDNDWWNVYAGLGRRIVTIRPDPHGTIRAMTTHMPDAAQKPLWDEATRSDRKTQQELIRRTFADVGWQMPRFLEAMEDAPDWYYWPMQQIKMEKWSTSRIICLGDAAYAPSPMTGSGTPLAIIGAYVLAGELTKLQPGDHPSKAFDAYEAVYHPFVDSVQDGIPWGIPGLAHPRTAWHRWLLSMFASSLSKLLAIEWVQKKIAYANPEENNDGFTLPPYPDLVGSVLNEKA
jgi:2-polyprenyl-6-methoxyphenol hydroxylase-like FAD-dependent oxidoreductase